MNKNNLPIYFSFAVVFGIVIGFFISGNSSSSSSSEQKIKRLINYINEDYVDKVDTNNLLDVAIQGMLADLDPHSVYIPKEDLAEVQQGLQGNFVGIGIQYRMINDTLTVIKPIEGGPSSKVGIESGDKILIANADTLYNKKIKTRSIFKALKGEIGTKVKLKVYRKQADSLFSVELERGKIPIKSVEVAYMLNDSTGFIKLERFGKSSYDEFKQALDKMLVKGMTSLVLDLRGNGGGFIHIANQIVDEFLEDGKLIVFTKNNKKRVQEYYATKSGDFEKGKVFLLIDESSASASEIVAGALQDNDKGVIIGRRSFGKGLVQEERGLGDGSAIRLTTARYYTPTGRSIQKPFKKKSLDVYNDYSAEIYHRDAELYSKDSIKIVDSLAYKTPKGKIVYGGGGIIPDVFVPLDSTENITGVYYGTINRFVFDYVDRNRRRLQELSVAEFSKQFDNSNKVLTKFLKKAKKIRAVRKINVRSKRAIKKYLKLLIARECYGEEAFCRVNEPYDDMIQKVYELLGKCNND